MALRFLVDENLRGKRLWRSLVRHNVIGGLPIDAVQVGDPIDLPLGSADTEILLWAEREDRILISRDQSTLAGHLATHLQTGHHLPGIFILDPGASYGAILNFLEVVAHAGNSDDFRDQLIYIP